MPTWCVMRCVGWYKLGVRRCAELGGTRAQGWVKGPSHLVLVGCWFRSSSNFSNENLVSIGYRIRLRTNMMWNWATLVLIHSKTTRSKMWALGFGTLDKMLCENANHFICSDFFAGEFSPKSNWKRIWFLPIQRSDFSFSQKFWSIFDKTFKKILGKCDTLE